MKKVKKCYLYTRVSTAIQVDGYSLDAQKNKLERYAEYEDMQIVGVYSDEGKSGKNTQGRPEFVQMLEDIKRGKDGVSFVLVYKLSRFGRNAADILGNLQLMQDYGVNLICVEEGIDSSKDSGKLIISVLAAVAELERENIRTQTMEGRKQKAREGRWNGGFAPYGYKLVNGELLIEEDEAEAIRIIFDKFVNTNLGYNGVAKYLKNNGIKKKIRQNGRLSEFTETFVKNALDNPVYMGKIAYGRRQTTKEDGKRNEFKVKRSDDFMLTDGIHQAIVSEELWNLAHKKRLATAVRLSKKHDLDHEHILSGIVKCPCCGKGLVGNINRKKKKNDEYYTTHFFYGCNKSKKAGGYQCDYRRQWTESVIDDAVAEIIMNMVNNPKFAKAIQEKIDAKLDTKTQEMDVENARKMLKQAIGVKDKLARQIDSLDITSATYEIKFDDLQKRLDDVYVKIKEASDYLEECEVRLEKVLKDKILGDSIYKYLMMFDKVYDMMSDLEKKQFYNNFIERVEIHGEAKKGEQIIKSIDFKMPIYYNGEETSHVGWDKNGSVETVVLLSKGMVDSRKVKVDFSLEDMDLSEFKGKATYEQVKAYVLEQTGLKVSSLYIAQIKKKCGLDVGENFNLPKSENVRQPQCTPEKEEAIMQAFKHFGII